MCNDAFRREFLAALTAGTFAYAAPEILLNQKAGAEVSDCPRRRTCRSMHSLLWGFTRGPSTAQSLNCLSILRLNPCTSLFPQADVYSFGVMLWEVVTGIAPVRGGMSDVSVPDDCPKEIAELIQVLFSDGVPTLCHHPAAAALLCWYR